MRNKLVVLWSMVATVCCSGCATITETEVHPVENKMAQISPTLEQEPQKVIKRKVAIARFTNETKYGQSFFIDKNDNKIGKQAMDILSSKLFDTGKFLMFERADLDQVQKELQLAGKGTLPLVNADYLIVGSISEFGRKTVSDVGIFSRVKKQEAFAKVHIRIVDVSTSRIIYSEEGTGTAFSEAGTVFGVGDKAGYDSSLNDKALESAISDLASNVIENLLERPWRSFILSATGQELVIAGGSSQNIKLGDEFEIVTRGRSVKNPQTGMMIELPGERQAIVKVKHLPKSGGDNEISVCEVLEGKLEIASNEFEKYYVQEIEAR